jgi:hypothetical protein
MKPVGIVAAEMTRRVRSLVHAVVVAAVISAANDATALQDAPPQTPGAGVPAASTPAVLAQHPVSFVIEAIVVEGVKHGSEKIVVSELLLTLGTAYTEAELRQALYRVRRLPFVVDADFSLRRGSERGRFELVVKVSQAWPVFFGGSAAAVGVDGPFGGNTEWFAQIAPQIGARVFFGGQNEISATVSGSATSQQPRFDSPNAFFDLSYRHHNVFGRHVVGTLFARKPQSSGRGLELGASVGVPLSRVSTLDGTFLRHHVDFGGLPAGAGSSETSYRGLLSWRLDTTDDPFVPRQGSRLLSELSYDSAEGTYTFLPNPNDPTQPVDTASIGNSQAVSVSVGGRRYWAVSTHGSLGLGASLRGSKGSSDIAISELGVEYGIDHRAGTGLLEVEFLRLLTSLGRGGTDFWSSAKAFLGLSAVSFDNKYADGLNLTSHTSSGSSGFTLSFSARGRWGIARVELTWNHDFRIRQEVR